ncbi:MAG: electron transfer flavoprotein subunit beta/FixA family protein [Sphaerochaeta sp.]|jgi:electron transfer flavoprotein beta subunit|nr:electron transfer flavoprotein subunit beta/FixA family protein [Sphaerochaeta sp.]MDX9916270.1 electron transfer flavoprotein subunit beta/FixA family protein [Sphaerochaeta sp.]
MHIIVPIKQVPQSSDVKMDPVTGTMIRSARSSVLNPLDLYALEAALLLKERHGGTVTAVTMGPPSALQILKEALSMGSDRAIHLTDRLFGGGDTYATSYVLAKAIEKIGTFDLIITGERATDGDTAQVGPGIAAWLDLALATYVSTITASNGTHLTVERLIEEGYQRVQVELPALLTVVKEIAIPRLPTLRGKKRAMATVIETWDAASIEADRTKIGLKGSPTRVVKIETPKVARSCEAHHADGDEATLAAVDRLLDFLEERNLLKGVSHG